MKAYLAAKEALYLLCVSVKMRIHLLSALLEAMSRLTTLGIVWRLLCIDIIWTGLCLLLLLTRGLSKPRDSLPWLALAAHSMKFASLIWKLEPLRFYTELTPRGPNYCHKVLSLISPQFPSSTVRQVSKTILWAHRNETKTSVCLTVL